ncbi:plastocyanin/azurin family copper-binding protein [uncultured Halomonas sp.]|uniref:plastocyanin/azurin family copper-binding protein n=1 Tax=uncultured Halomonas sp. TaxID=173971 RepID=UPI00260C9ABA|nr:plastocyanin/azurin family copper-binding protein [uncultured Halomonas sp.]
MSLTRRRFLVMSGGIAALAALPLAIAEPEHEVEIAMLGTARGERVWFMPLGIAVAPSTRVRFVNRDPGNSHTATAYHPANFERSQRIPDAAVPFHSGFLLPGDAFEVVLDAPGVYDYYCLPHERAGMVGRIVVGTPETPGWQGAVVATDHAAATALAALPSVERILAHGQVMPEEAA